MSDKKKNAIKIIEDAEDIYRLAEGLKIQERKVLDFSNPVNPLKVSKKIKAEIRKQLKYLHNYPDPEAKRLRKRIAQYYGISFEKILCGNGSTELIYLLARTLKPQKVLILAPAYPEYERAVSIAGIGEHRSEIEYLFLKAENDFKISPDEFIAVLKKGMNSTHNTQQVTRYFNMAFLCNPNNPTGVLIKREDILTIVDVARQIECYLVVDESYIDYCADESVIVDTENNPYLIVVKSFSSFYSLSGLRIGFGVFPHNLIKGLLEYKEPWTVNNLSQRAAVIAFKDRVYKKETLRVITEEKDFMEKSFARLGIKFFHSDANFYLVKIENAEEIYKRLKRKGILLKHCSDFKGLDNTYLRIAVKSHRENSILIKELTSILKNRLYSQGID